MESVLRYLRADHPEAILDVMCSGPERVTHEYGIEAVPLYSHYRYEHGKPGIRGALTKYLLIALGMVIDTVRTAMWVRRHEVVIVPGMGVLAASVPIRPWEIPYAMFVLCASGKLFGTKVALVSVGADVINQPLTRKLCTVAARLAFYRSYRDTKSREAMRQQGVDTAVQGRVYPDLVFGIPAPPHNPGDVRSVGVGIMAYYGTNDDCGGQRPEIHASYVGKMKIFVRWLVDGGYKVRLFAGDVNDDCAVQEILTDVREHRPGLDPMPLSLS